MSDGLSGLVNRTIAWADGLQRRHGVLGFPYAVVKKYGDDAGGRHAALITYYGFLSIFPLLLLGVAVLTRGAGLAPGPAPAADHRDRAAGVAAHDRALAGHLADLDHPVRPRPDRLAVLRNRCGVLRLPDAEPRGGGPAPSSGPVLLPVRPGVRDARDAAGRGLAVGTLTVVATALPGPAVQRAAAVAGSALVIFAILLLGARLLLVRPGPCGQAP